MKRGKDKLLKHVCGLQLEVERKLRVLLTKEKKQAEQEAALATGLCAGRGFP